MTDFSLNLNNSKKKSQVKPYFLHKFKATFTLSSCDPVKNTEDLHSQ